MEKKSEAITTLLAHDKVLGVIFKESGLFPDTKSESQAIVKIMAGREIGLQEIEAMTGLNIFSGKISIGGNVMAAKVKGNPKYDYRATISDESCSIDFYEFTIDGKGNPIKERLGNSTFTMQDAKNAKLSTKDNWIKWKRNMMFNRALSNGVKWYCPDVFGSSPVYTPDELGIDENEDGEPINITPPVPKKPDKQPKVDKPTKSFKQCTSCGNSIPKDNDSGLCAKCIGGNPDDPEPVDVEFEDVEEPVNPDESHPEKENIPERKAEVEEFDESDVGESELETVDDTKTDNPLTIIPESIIDGIKKPRGALEAILDYAMKVEKLREVKPVVISHYKAWETGEPSLCNIPETNIIRIVESLTGVKLKKKEKSHKCDCGKRITEAEMNQRDGFCMSCFSSMSPDED